MTDINSITQNIFKDDLHNYTFNISNNGSIKNVNNKNINHILKKNKYTIYKYENGLLLEYLLIKYAKYNMKQIYKEEPYIDILHRFRDRGNRRLNVSYYVKSTLLNEFASDHGIRDKHTLYFNMLKYNSKMTNDFFCKTYLLKDIKNINDVYILRTFGKFTSGGGKNIYIVENTKQLNIIKKKININDYIATEYITNPLLFKNRKFHIRVPFIITYINNKISFSIFKHLRIHQAKLPYINDDYTNKNIHDSHIKSTDDDYFFYDEFKDNKNYYDIIKQIKLLINECVNMAKPGITLYDETKNSYVIYVADIIITDDYNIKLLEVNGQFPGYNFINRINNNKQILFNKNYFRWLFNKAIAPIFYPKLLLFNQDIDIKNRYYDIIRDNNILTIKLNIKCDDILIFYVIIINLLCPYKKIYDITVLDLTKSNIWKKTCDIIKCNYITSGKKYTLVISDDLSIQKCKKYIITENFIKFNKKFNKKFYKGIIKFYDKNFYVYKK